MGSMEPTELLALKKHVQRLAKDIHLIPKVAYEGLRSQVEDSCRESMASLPDSMIRKSTEKIFNDLRRFLHLNSSDETSVISILSQDSAMKIGNNLHNLPSILKGNMYTVLRSLFDDDDVPVEGSYYGNFAVS